MVLPLPTLDDRSFADLADEGRSMIPALDPGWTNHNPSDPGITLLELFAWLTDILLYRIDRITDRHRIVFLRLLNGPDWTPPVPTTGAALDEEVRRTVEMLRQRYRAVTAEDYEALALEASPDVARARCVPRRNLETTDDAARDRPSEGHVSVILVPRATAQDGDGVGARRMPQPSPDLRQAVAAYLEPRRLLTARVHVVGPVYAPVGAELLVVRRPDAAPGVEDRLRAAFAGFLDPDPPDPGLGWPFGRAILASDLYRALEAVAGVDYLIDVQLASARRDDDPPSVVAAVPLAPNDDGEPVGLRLKAHQLPTPDPQALAVFVGAAARIANVAVALTALPGADLPTLRRTAYAAVRAQLHPLHGGPGGNARVTVAADALVAAVNAALAAAAPGGAALDATRVALRDETGAAVSAITFEAGELADWRIALTLAGGAG